MKKLSFVLALIAVLVFAISPGYASVNNNSGNLTAVDQAVTLGVGNCGTTTFQLSGTFTATVTFEALTGNATWVAIPAINVNTDARATTATAAGIYQVSGSGLNQVRARVSAYTSGTVVVNAQCGEGSTFVAQPVTGTVTANAGTGTLATKETQPTTSTVTSVASSATSVTILASNSARRQATIFNDSTQVLYLKLGATASTTSYTVQVASNGYFELPQPVYTGIIDGVWASANGNARVTELTN